MRPHCHALEAFMRIKPAIRLMVSAVYSISVLRPAILIVAGLAASTALAVAQGSRPKAIPYCAELKELNNHAMSRQRFAPIIGQPRDGN
jgi:hypothetical protein